MAEIPNVYETFDANDKTKQFNLLPAFDKYAKSKGFNEQAITDAKLAISRQFTDFNKEGMDDRRFRNIVRTIGDMVENELYKAKDALAKKSDALKGTEIRNLAEKMGLTPEQQLSELNSKIKTSMDEIRNLGFQANIDQGGIVRVSGNALPTEIVAARQIAKTIEDLHKQKMALIKSNPNLAQLTQ